MSPTTLNRTARRVGLALLASAIAACAPLQPVDLPAESTPAPSHADLWEGLEQVRADDWFALLNDGPGSLDWRLKAIDAASESIDLQTFLWTMDTAGSLVLDHLVTAADRGVVVKLLVDDTFLIGEDELLLAIHRHPNMSYRVFNPNKRRIGGHALRTALNLDEFGRLDHRMHNKVMVIDNRVAIVGGRNIADEYFGLHSQANFRDLELIVGGPIVQTLSASFDEYWNNPWAVPIDLLSDIRTSPMDLEAARHIREHAFALHRELGPDAMREAWHEQARQALPGHATLLVDQPPVAKPDASTEAPVQLANRLHQEFDTANEEIIVVSAYLIPTPVATDMFTGIQERGVRVRILTNSIASNNHLVAHSAYRNHIDELLHQGVSLHEVRVDAKDRGLHMLTPVEEKQLALHAKALIVDDDTVFIGSPNLDPRSIRLNMEMGLLIESRELNQALRAALEPDFRHANAWQLELDGEGKVNWVSEDQTLTVQPANSFMQRIEDWFLSHLPLEGEL